jgi:hypothetical protein
MEKLKFFFSQKQRNKGQSFVELAIILSVLLFLLVGMVEFGYLLNQYATLVEGAREGARFGSSGKIDPYIRTTLPYTENGAFFEAVDCIIEGSHGQNCASNTINNGALEPIVLDPARDDVIITFYRVVNGGINQTFGPWHRYGSGKTPKITTADVQRSLKASAPDSGVLVVEIFYSNHQLIKFPIFTNVFPDPIDLNTYVIMPLALAKPTPIP